MKKILRPLSILLTLAAILSFAAMFSACGKLDRTQKLTAHTWKRTTESGYEITIQFKTNGDYQGEYIKTTTLNGHTVENDDSWVRWKTKNETELSLWPDNPPPWEEYRFVELNEKDLQTGINRAESFEWYVSDNYFVIGYDVYQPAD